MNGWSLARLVTCASAALCGCAPPAATRAPVAEAAAPSAAAPPTHQVFALYKFQHQIGVEHAIDDGRQLRSVFTFTDRATPVPLAAVYERAVDGSPAHFALWGQTSRWARIDDRVDLVGAQLSVVQDGTSRQQAAPAQFFVGSSYAPVAMIQELLP